MAMIEAPHAMFLSMVCVHIDELLQILLHRDETP